jgi:hypothetical protein
MTNYNIITPITFTPLQNTLTALASRTSRLLANPNLVAIFWGRQWEDPAESRLRAEREGLIRFLDSVAPRLIQDIGNTYNALIQPQSITAPAGLSAAKTWLHPPDGDAGDSIITALLRNVALDQSLPRPTPDTLYLLYLPPGVDAVRVVAGRPHAEPIRQRSCVHFCSYHHLVDPGLGFPVTYAVIPYPKCDGCIQGKSTFDSLTYLTSHEIVNAVTDPEYGAGLFDPHHGEVCDPCARKPKRVDNYLVAQLWSPSANNGQGGCV